MVKKVRVDSYTRTTKNGKKVKVKSHTRHHGQGKNLMKRKYRGPQDSGHGELQTRRLGKKQREEIKEKGETKVVLNGKERKLKEEDVIDGRKYQVYDRSDKEGMSIRKPSKDRKIDAGHTSKNPDGKPFNGD